jgi:hypothetical protein
MNVSLGNESAVGAYREPGSEEVLYREHPGQRVTTVEFPDDDISLQEAVSVVNEVVKHHFQDGSSPVWVECDKEGLKALLCEQYHINPRHNVRPKNWGADVEPEEEGDE